MTEEDFEHKGDKKTVKLLRELRLNKEGADEPYNPKSPRASQGSLMSARMKKNMSPRSFDRNGNGSELGEGSIEMKQMSFIPGAGIELN